MGISRNKYDIRICRASRECSLALCFLLIDYPFSFPLYWVGVIPCAFLNAYEK